MRVAASQRRLARAAGSVLGFDPSAGSDLVQGGIVVQGQQGQRTDGRQTCCNAVFDVCQAWLKVIPQAQTHAIAEHTLGERTVRVQATGRFKARNRFFIAA